MKQRCEKTRDGVWVAVLIPELQKDLSEIKGSVARMARDLLQGAIPCRPSSHRSPAMSDRSPVKWRHFQADIILCAVRWYLRYALSYRDVEEFLEERGVGVDHTTVFRWVQRYGPELDKRCRPSLRATNDSYRVDETYIKIKKQWHYLYRAVDSTEATLDFMLSATQFLEVGKEALFSRSAARK
jgi:DDE domain